MTKMLGQVAGFLVLHFQLASTDRTDILYFLYKMISLDDPDVSDYLRFRTGLQFKQLVPRKQRT